MAWQVPNPFYISDSTLQAFESCARKLEFGKLYQHPREQQSVHTIAGHALHAGYQEFLTSNDLDKAVFKMMMEYDLEIESNPNHFKSLEACYATLMAMCSSGLMLEYELAYIEDLNGVVRPAIEVPFEIHIKGFDLNPDPSGEPITVVYRGFIDFIYFNRLTGKFVVIDIKTHRDNTIDVTAKYCFAEQMIPYGLVIQKVLDLNVQDFEIRYLDVYIDIAEPKTSVYPFDKGPEDIQDWLKKLYLQISMIRTYLDLGWFPRSGKSCMSFRRPCTYFGVCQHRNSETIQKLILGFNEPYEEVDLKPWVKVELEMGTYG